MTRLVTIAIDAMGGDFGPRAIVPASFKILKEIPHCRILLVGQKAEIKQYSEQLDPSNALRDRYSIIETQKIIPNDASFAHATHRSKDTSMRVALELVRDGAAHVCLSAGNTGVLMGLAKILLQPITNVERPALMGLVPNSKGTETVVLDLGANILCSADVLTQFALMGNSVALKLLNIQKPKVALLNVGTEENKGLDAVKLAAESLKSRKDIHYIGYVESNELLLGKADVIVCDGLAGNIMLKAVEGTLRVVLSFSKQQKKRSSLLTKWVDKWFQHEIIKHFGNLEPEQYNGAYLLGLKNPVVKSHGAANKTAFYEAISRSIKMVEQDIIKHITTHLSE